jgi:hypothetical protein
VTHYLLVALAVYLFALGTFLDPRRPKRALLGYAGYALAWPVALGVVWVFWWAEHRARLKECVK